ncbi:MAG: PilW family protein [Methylococcaceae bacterium]
MLKTKQQKGLTLIEVLIGLLVGAIITAGAISVFGNSVKSSSDNVKITRLNQDLRAMMDIMVREIRRAGYASSDPNLNDSDGDTINDALMNNPFAQVTAVTSSCLVFMYNRDYNNDNDSGVTETIPVVDNDERLGFQLFGNALRMRTSANEASFSSCVGSVNNTWQTITDPDVEITNLDFDLSETVLNATSMITDEAPDDGIMDGDDNDNKLCDLGEACNTCTLDGAAPEPACLYIRTVSITLTGRLTDDNAVTQTIIEQVRIRNDRYLAAVP